jgi:hypothetical protein
MLPAAEDQPWMEISNVRNLARSGRFKIAVLQGRSNYDFEGAYGSSRVVRIADVDESAVVVNLGRATIATAALNAAASRKST